MWYRSCYTGNVIHSSAAHLINNLYGEDAFDALVVTNILSKAENPSVIDVLRDTHSINLAVLRYREIHHCTVKEAKYQVKILKRDMASFKNNKKRFPRKRVKSNEPTQSV